MSTGNLGIRLVDISTSKCYKQATSLMANSGRQLGSSHYDKL